MPMQRWMQSAAGGTSQRLKPALAMVRSRSRMPGIPPAGIARSNDVVVIGVSPLDSHLFDACYEIRLSAASTWSIVHADGLDRNIVVPQLRRVISGQLPFARIAAALRGDRPAPVRAIRGLRA